MPQVEVTSILTPTVSLMFRRGRRHRTRAENHYYIIIRLSKEEIDKMMKEAESHAGEDTKRKEVIESRNRLTAWLQRRKNFRQNKDSSMRARRRKSKRRCRVENRSAGDDTAAMNTAFDRLQTACINLRKCFTARRVRSNKRNGKRRASFFGNGKR